MKIGFCGTMSVGKTTLVNSLKELPEFKNYKFATERSKYLKSIGIPLNTDSTLKGQTIFFSSIISSQSRQTFIVPPFYIYLNDNYGNTMSNNYHLNK